MAVVNVKVVNIRKQHYDNLRDWMDDCNNVYIGRKGIVFIEGSRFPKQNSIWANPFKIDSANDRDTVIKKYREYIIQKIEEESLHEELLNLEGKNLGCWCKPKKCHGDVFLSLINEYKEKMGR